MSHHVPTIELLRRAFQHEHAPDNFEAIYQRALHARRRSNRSAADPPSLHPRLPAAATPSGPTDEWADGVLVTPDGRDGRVEGIVEAKTAAPAAGAVEHQPSRLPQRQAGARVPADAEGGGQVEPEHRTILALDIQAFGDPARTNLIRLELRRHLRWLLQQLTSDAGISATQFASADTGDGLLLSISAEVSSVRVLDRLVPQLARRLVAFNQGKPERERMRVRVAVHAGGVLADPEPLQGEAVIHACRLLDAPTVRVCLQVTAEPVAVIVSRVLYQDVVRHGYGGIDPAGWHQVIAQVKETREPAWVHVPGDPDAPRHAGVVVKPRPQGPPDAALVPRELPADAPVFVGRQEDLERLKALLGTAGRDDADGVAVAAIDGIGGVGKSALAIHAAYQLAARFPDGQLYVNLRGSTPGLTPASPVSAVSMFLRSLGMPGSAVPTELEEAAARYRSLLANRRVLIVLDNARSAEQVRPLLPGSPGCAVIITSRDTLTLPDGAVRFSLGVLAEPDAIALLGRWVGPERIQAEPAAAAQLVRACGLLPLAIQLAGRRLATRANWTIQEYVDRVTGGRRLDHLRFGDQQVRATFEVSYQALGEEDAELAWVFRLLALLDTPDVGVPAAAALLDRPAAWVETALERLVDANLLEQPAPGRYRFHDLLREFAHEHAHRTEPDDVSSAALARVFAFFLATIRLANRLLMPGRHHHHSDSQQPGPDDELAFPKQAEALAWLDVERVNLIMAVRQAAQQPDDSARLACRLVEALFGYFELRGHWYTWEKLNHIVLEVAKRRGDREAQARAHDELGVIYRHLGQLDRALTAHREGLAIRRALGNEHDQSVSLNNLGEVYRRQRNYTGALACHQKAYEIALRLDDRFGRARGLENLGVNHEKLDQYEQALACLTEALDLYRELGNRRSEATILNHLGVVHRRQGQHRKALGFHEDALVIRDQLGDLYGKAETLHDLGVVARALGEHQHAWEHWQRAFRIFTELGAPEAGELDALLASVKTRRYS